MARKKKTTRYTTKSGKSYRWIQILHTAAKYAGVPCNAGKSKIAQQVILKNPQYAGKGHKKAVILFALDCLDAGLPACIGTKRKASAAPMKKGKPRKAGVSELGFPHIKWDGSKWLPKNEYENFYSTRAWRELRYLALRNTEGRCQCCGAKASDGVQIHVDHILPRAARPDLQLSLDNLQVLCDDCNIGKGAWDATDWR